MNAVRASCGLVRGSRDGSPIPLALRLLGDLKLVLLCLVVLAFSTDLRVSPTLSVDPAARPTFQLFEFAAFPLLLVLLLESWFGGARGRLYARSDAYFLIFVGWAVLISGMGEDFSHAISRVKDFFMAWVVFCGVRSLSRRYAWFFAAWTLAVILFWAAFGVLQFLGLDPWFGSDVGQLFRVAVNWKTVVNPISGELKESAFAQGIYLYPQNYTYYMLVPLFVLARLRQRHWAWTASFLVVLLAMIGSGSKTFYVIILLLLLWRALRSIRVSKSEAFLICLSLIAFGGGLGLFLSKENFLEAIGTFIWRTEQWSDTMTMVLHQPIVLLAGHGTEKMTEIYSRFNYPNPHNAIMYFSIEFGLIGAGLFFLYLKQGLGLFNKPPGLADRAGVRLDLEIARGLRNGILFTLVMALLDDYFVQTQLTALFMFYLGVYWLMNKVGREDLRARSGLR